MAALVLLVVLVAYVASPYVLDMLDEWRHRRRMALLARLQQLPPGDPERKRILAALWRENRHG